MARIFWKLCLVVLSAGFLAWGITAARATPAKPKTSQKSAAHSSQPKPYHFPAGGRRLLPDYSLVALYGTPGMPVLGVLGAQDLSHTIARVKALAKTYRPHTAAHVLPTLEIITTVASAYPTDNGDYSQEIDPDTLWPWVRAARKAGVYVVLDLQPGRADFLQQAKQYEPLLREPNVGLALDPEWRLKPHQLPLEQIGQVNIKEVNVTAKWLAQLTSHYQLPQKLFLLHEFRLTMLPSRHKLDTSHKQLAYVIQMDGQGTQSEKNATWRAVTAKPPQHTYFGWKNFYRKDSPVLTPAQTMHKKPKPRYVSYQ